MVNLSVGFGTYMCLPGDMQGAHLWPVDWDVTSQKPRIPTSTTKLFSGLPEAQEIFDDFFSKPQKYSKDFYPADLNRQLIDRMIIPAIVAYLGAKGALKCEFEKNVSRNRIFYIPVFNDAVAREKMLRMPLRLSDELESLFSIGRSPQEFSGELIGWNEENFETVHYRKMNIGFANGANPKAYKKARAFLIACTGDDPYHANDVLVSTVQTQSYASTYGLWRKGCFNESDIKKSIADCGINKRIVFDETQVTYIPAPEDSL